MTRRAIVARLCFSYAKACSAVIHFVVLVPRKFDVFSLSISSDRKIRNLSLWTKIYSIQSNAFVYWFVFFPYVRKYLSTLVHAAHSFSQQLKQRKQSFFLFSLRGFAFNPIQDGLFRGCSQMGEVGQKGPPSLKSVTHILQWWNLAELYLTQRRSKNYMNHMTHPLSSADISIFSSEISKVCYIKKYRYRLHFNT